MLTPELIEALRISAGKVADPISQFLIEDIARRIAGAGQLTSTAAYQVYRAQQLGLSRKEVEHRLRKMLGASKEEIKDLLTQSAEVGYDFDLKNLPTAAVPFEQNGRIQQMVMAAVALAEGDFTNLTQTLGMVDPFGNVQPLREAYRKSMDYAFQQVFTGATDYNTAIRQASKNISDQGVRVIDYESGVHTSLEAAVRRNIMGGLGLLQEQISDYNHDRFGANGWEISAHANSAPDHESIQGKQYTDAQYKALNEGLHRRIGTLNCGHAAFPIVLGVSEPQYSEEDLRQFRENNAGGISFEGRHYTGYEATQKQRQIERGIRTQERRIVVDEATGAESLQQNQIKLHRLNEVYRNFSKAAGLRTERERLMVVGFGKGHARRANATAKAIENRANKAYNEGSTDANVKVYLRDQKLRTKLQSDTQPKTIERGKQGKHILGHNNYIAGRSYLTITEKEAQELIDHYAGTGLIDRDRRGHFKNKELVTADRDIGVNISTIDGIETPTNRFYIHYSKSGTHIVPTLKGKEKS